MKKTLVITVLYLINISVFSQDPFATKSIFNKADSLFYSGNYELAIQEYHAHPDSLDSNFFATGALACSYAMLVNADSAFVYLDKIMELGTTEWVLGESSYYFIYKDERWSKLKNYCRDYVASKGYTKPYLCLELMEMGMKDQAYYFDIDFVGRKSHIAKHLWQLKKELNKQNLVQIEKIIAEQGYPKRSEVGDHASGVAFTIIQHSNLETQKKYLPVLTELAKKGEIFKEDWALLLDRVLINEGKKQVYGSQVRENPETGKAELYPVEDEKNLNKRRAEIDLIPIEDYLKYMGIEYIAPK
jgi:hypothetical protein